MTVSLDGRPGSGPQRTRVGPWRLLSPLGEGGMGVVHLAADDAGRRVALKVLRPHVVSDSESRERLAREVALLGRVDSPRVAAVLDADPWDEVPWVATRYVPGWSLHEHLRAEGPMVGRDLRWFARCLAEALADVHATGVVHRDVKPANILIEGRSPVLIDFGLARLAEDTRLTQVGFLMGTPGYLAPEVLTGAEATPAADIHAFGACLAYAATGRPPFGRGPGVAVMDRVRRGEHDLTGLDPGVRPMVEACLHPDPGSRPSARTVVTALQAVPDTDEAAYAPVRAPGQVQAVSTRPAQEADPTMPLVVATATRTSGRLTSLLSRSSLSPTPAPTRVLPQPLPVNRGVAQPFRAQPASRPVTGPSTAARPRLEPGSGAGTLLGALGVGVLAVVVTLFLAAPWVAVGAVLAGAHALRTWSWTSQARREKVWRRGRRRWYDGPAAVALAPWYAVVALGGTTLVAAWVGLALSAVAVAAVLIGAPVTGGLAVGGVVLAACVLTGPGARRVRHPLHAALRGLSQSTPTSVIALGCLAVLVAALAFSAAAGPSWSPWGSPVAWLR